MKKKGTKKPKRGRGWELKTGNVTLIELANGGHWGSAPPRGLGDGMVDRSDTQP
ncbi:MAG TPA: hypothetical protein VHU86_10520 [Solirubrobacterales bacterium]|nr:hypothetical protein [Solirubrobacterales bacterium]